MNKLKLTLCLVLAALALSAFATPHHATSAQRMVLGLEAPG